MTTDVVITTLWMAVLFGAVFGAIETVKRRFGISSEVMRRVAHVASGLLVWLDYILLPPLVFVLLVGGGWFVFFTVSKLNLLTSVNDVARRTYGQYVLTAGYLGSYGISLWEPAVFVPSILIITFADSFAGLAGTLLKSSHKTWIGSSVFFAVSLAILLVTGIVPIGASVVVALSLTVIERFTPLGMDNVTVPVAAALLLVAF